MQEYFVVVGSEGNKSVDFAGIHVQLIFSESEGSLESRLKLPSVQLSLAEDIEMLGLCSSPRVIQNLL
jgi:hypothetical protein